MKSASKKRVLSFAGVDPLKLLGVNDRNIRLIEEHFDESIVVRGEEIIINGKKKRIEELTGVLETLIRIASSGRTVTEGDILTVIRGGRFDSSRIESLKDTVVFYSTARRKSVVPRSLRQKEYVDAVRESDIVFAIGPAGTGKTYLAIAMALAALKNREVERIFISRPVVEAGENLGFLPGDLQEKIDPYLRPIFDALREMVGNEKLQRMIESGVIEIAPLAYMRGRTLNNSMAILDEAQNSTVVQMKMFLTRLGANAKAVITGDITQIDLTEPERSGLVVVRDILHDVEGIKFITFGEEDVVRHRLVKRIIRAFAVKADRLRRRAGDATPSGLPVESERNESPVHSEEADG